MYLTGFADEAAGDIDGQIRATKELGWEYIESRGVNGANIHDLSDEDFDIVYGKLQDAGVKINSFGSAIANWAKKINEPFDSSLEEAKRAIPRMKKLGTKLIRIMSFAVIDGQSIDEQMAEERIKRLRTIYSMFNDAGLIPVHENCMNYGGIGWQYTLELVEKIPGLKLVFDTGNQVDHKNKPFLRQPAWEFYSHVKDHIAYVHIKDGIWDYEKKRTIYTWPGEGEGDVRAIVKDLLKNGYDGGFSMEPHMEIVFHESSSTASPADIRYKTYVDYGKRFMQLIEDVRK